MSQGLVTFFGQARKVTKIITALTQSGKDPEESRKREDTGNKKGKGYRYGIFAIFFCRDRKIMSRTSFCLPSYLFKTARQLPMGNRSCR